VLSSGFSEVEAAQRFRDRGSAGFLQKPYTASALARKLKQALRTAGGGFSLL
jgi:FixJ family two-component response regulator